MRQATALDESRGLPNGPPRPLKPAHELFGEILLELGRPAEAMDQFRMALRRLPNRGRSVLGLARAAAASGARDVARQSYERVLALWEDQDTLPGYREAADYLERDRLP